MFRLAANLSFQFADVPFLERFGCAARAGFRAVEFNYVDGVAPREVVHRLEENRLLHVLSGIPSSPGDKGLAAVPKRESEFRERFWRGLEFAAQTKCRLLHVTTGVVALDEHHDAAQTFVANIEYALAVADAFDVRLVVEAINQTDVPNYFIRSLDDAVNWVKTIGDPRFGLILDLYHAGIEGLSASAAVANGLESALHIQVAAVPTRNEPDPECPDTLRAFLEIAASSYNGWIGCEYRPANGTLLGLNWRDRLRSSIVEAQSNLSR